jgi:hypothetical protein
MRTNLPVTQNAYDFASSETLLSTTDTNSRSTYANAAFVRTSGFEQDELVGHNGSLTGYFSVRTKPSAGGPTGCLRYHFGRVENGTL